MKCQLAKELLLSDYIDSELDQKRYVELQKHLKSCSECWEVFEAVRRTEDILRTSTDPVPPEHVWLLIKERIVSRPGYVLEKITDRLSWLWDEFFSAPRRLAYGATLATVVIFCGIALPLTMHFLPEKTAPVYEEKNQASSAVESADSLLWLDEEFLEIVEDHASL
ncbi:MAG: zf-HC2 domain-containing protein [Candidatus Omnitrophica bacterium]|nr:zf-HC2 domain-containing protein [Candidatus Omnitrophota bacterium]